ncbi:phosphatidylethanolamine-binding protein [Phaeosphaeria sp. MPI-PUGE-AT-0046c]|nr:phosphatidylethanolamine-binding protein [Phaeosphaeria sp. MPI-PUGE-AT-0046c]
MQGYHFGIKPQRPSEKHISHITNPTTSSKNYLFQVTSPIWPQPSYPPSNPPPFSPPPLIPSSFTPTLSLTITYPSLSPSSGSLIRVHQAATQPVISISPSPPPGSNYTFMLIDPDAPTPADPKFAYWRHWVVSNISSANLDSDDIVKAGNTLTPYLAPGPKDESGPHRYLFLLFKEPEGLEVRKEDVGGDEFVERRSFGAREFVEKWGLELVGVQWMRGVGDGWVGEKEEL